MNLGFWVFEFFFGPSNNWKKKVLGCVLTVSEPCPVVSNRCSNRKIIFLKRDTKDRVSDTCRTGIQRASVSHLCRTQDTMTMGLNGGGDMPPVPVQDFASRPCPHPRRGSPLPVPHEDLDPCGYLRVLIRKTKKNL